MSDKFNPQQQGGGRFGMIRPSFWWNAKDQGWTQDEREVALFLLCSDRGWEGGAYRVPTGFIGGDTGIEGGRVEAALAGLERHGFIAREGDWVLIINYIKWNPIRGENNIRGALAKAETVRPERFREFIVKAIRGEAPVWEATTPVPTPVPTPPGPPPDPVPTGGGENRDKRIEIRDKREYMCSSEISDAAGAVRDVFDHYRTYHPRAHPKPKSKSKEWRAIKARLDEGYTVDDLKKAIDGCHVSPFHQGENDRCKKYDSLELIVRDGSKVQQFMEIWENRNESKIHVDPNSWLAVHADDVKRRAGKSSGFDPDNLRIFDADDDLDPGRG